MEKLLCYDKSNNQFGSVVLDIVSLIKMAWKNCHFLPLVQKRHGKAAVFHRWWKKRYGKTAVFCRWKKKTEMKLLIFANGGKNGN